MQSHYFLLYLSFGIEFSLGTFILDIGDYGHLSSNLIQLVCWLNTSQTSNNCHSQKLLASYSILFIKLQNFLFITSNNGVSFYLDLFWDCVSCIHLYRTVTDVTFCDGGLGQCTDPHNQGGYNYSATKMHKRTAKAICKTRHA